MNFQDKCSNTGEKYDTRLATNSGLPPEFLKFLAGQGIDTQAYAAASSLPRFIRINPRQNEAEAIATLQSELGVEPKEVEWLPGFYSLPSSIKIAGCTAYKEGRIYGIDASSGAAVLALDPQQGDHVLELCTAPGGKLCMIGDILKGYGSVTGVDSSMERSSACRNILRKYAVPGCRLFRGDATTFLVPPPDASKPKEFQRSYGPQRKRRRQHSMSGESHALIWDTFNKPHKIWNDTSDNMTSNAPNSHEQSITGRPSETVESNSGRNKLTAETSQNMQNEVKGATIQVINLHEPAPRSGHGSAGCDDIATGSASAPASLYDRVLVDAECTHDGSFRHMEKFRGKAWEDFRDKFLGRLEELHSLQRKLLQQGFRLLKTGGVLVYSTCSMTRAQNEDVVQWLLDSEGHSNVVTEEIPNVHEWPCSPGGIQHSIRLNPNVSKTSALFICRLRKVAATTVARNSV